MARAPACHAGGRGFDSRPSCHREAESRGPQGPRLFCLPMTVRLVRIASTIHPSASRSDIADIQKCIPMPSITANVSRLPARVLADALRMTAGIEGSTKGHFGRLLMQMGDLRLDAQGPISSTMKTMGLTCYFHRETLVYPTFCRKSTSDSADSLPDVLWTVLPPVCHLVGASFC